MAKRRRAVKGGAGPTEGVRERRAAFEAYLLEHGDATLVRLWREYDEARKASLKSSLGRTLEMAEQVAKGMGQIKRQMEKMARKAQRRKKGGRGT